MQVEKLEIISNYKREVRTAGTILDVIAGLNKSAGKDRDKGRTVL